MSKTKKTDPASDAKQREEEFVKLLGTPFESVAIGEKEMADARVVRSQICGKIAALEAQAAEMRVLKANADLSLAVIERRLAITRNSEK